MSTGPASRRPSSSGSPAPCITAKPRTPRDGRPGERSRAPLSPPADSPDEGPGEELGPNPVEMPHLDGRDTMSFLCDTLRVTALPRNPFGF